MSNEELERRRAEIAEFKSKFPYVVIEVPGAEALASWERLKRERLETPVVIGDDDALMTMYDPFYPTQGYTPPTIAKILEDASKIRFPEDLFKERAEESAHAAAFLDEYLSDPNAKLPKVVDATSTQ